MQIIIEWLLAFCLPALLSYALGFIFRRQKYFGVIIVHAALIISIIISNYYLTRQGYALVFQHSTTTITFFAISIIIAFILLGIFGLWYAISAIIQQLSIISITSLLITQLHFTTILWLVVPLYALGHLIMPKYWQFKLPLTLIWGTLAILLYLRFDDPFLNEALHIIGGAIFIRLGLLYAKKDNQQTRKKRI